MHKNLIPTYYLHSIFDINIDKLVKLNCQVLLCDIDNTLVSPFQSLPEERVKLLINKLKENNIKVVLVSNNTHQRVAPFATALQVEYIEQCKKPKTNKIFQYLVDNNYQLENVFAIGDQIMTDILCANRLGVKVILVDRMYKKEQLITFFPRRLDKIIRFFLKKKKLLKEL